jgi:hypothetical protein
MGFVSCRFDPCTSLHASGGARPFTCGRDPQLQPADGAQGGQLSRCSSTVKACHRVAGRRGRCGLAGAMVAMGCGFRARCPRAVTRAYDLVKLACAHTSLGGFCARFNLCARLRCRWWASLCNFGAGHLHGAGTGRSCAGSGALARRAGCLSTHARECSCRLRLRGWSSWGRKPRARGRWTHTAPRHTGTPSDLRKCTDSRDGLCARPHAYRCALGHQSRQERARGAPPAVTARAPTLALAACGCDFADGTLAAIACGFCRPCGLKVSSIRLIVFGTRVHTHTTRTNSKHYSSCVYEQSYTAQRHETRAHAKDMRGQKRGPIINSIGASRSAELGRCSVDLLQAREVRMIDDI